ncbi:MAG: type II toxin-antitoxin system PrlF family antitoxin [Rhizomicrobium sp.]
MTTAFKEASTITAKGQTTVPKSVRRALGVDYGGKIAFHVENGRVTVSNAKAEHRDPALGAFLGLIEQDIAAGRNVRDLPADVAMALRKIAKRVRVDLDETLDGDVAI